MACLEKGEAERQEGGKDTERGGIWSFISHYLQTEFQNSPWRRCFAVSLQLTRCPVLLPVVVPPVLKPFLNPVENQLKPVFRREKAIKLTCSLRALTSRCSYLGMTWLMRYASDTTPFFFFFCVQVMKFMPCFPVGAFSCFWFWLLPFSPLLPLQIQNAEKRMSPPGHLRHPRVFAPVPPRQPSGPAGAPSASQRFPSCPPLAPPLLRRLQ